MSDCGEIHLTDFLVQKSKDGCVLSMLKLMGAPIIGTVTLRVDPEYDMVSEREEAFRSTKYTWRKK